MVLVTFVVPLVRFNVQPVMLPDTLVQATVMALEPAAPRVTVKVEAAGGVVTVTVFDSADGTVRP